MHKSLDEFEFKPDPTIFNTELPALERLKIQCKFFLQLQFLYWDFFCQ